MRRIWVIFSLSIFTSNYFLEVAWLGFYAVLEQEEYPEPCSMYEVSRRCLSWSLLHPQYVGVPLSPFLFSHLSPHHFFWPVVSAMEVWTKVKELMNAFGKYSEVTPEVVVHAKIRSTMLHVWFCKSEMIFFLGLSVSLIICSCSLLSLKKSR